MEYSIVNYSELENETGRLDAEYYHPRNLKLLEILSSKKCKKIADFAWVTDGIHASIDFDPESGINLISAMAPKENYFDLSRSGFISEKQDEANKRTRLRENDVIISTVGTIGNCAVVDKKILPANCDRHVGIIRVKEEVEPYFLSSFLLSKYGRFQSFRESTGNVQLNLYIYKLKEILIPNLSITIQDYVQKVCKKSQELIEKSSILYEQAEQLLLTELGLVNWKPVHQLAFTKMFTDTVYADRIDADHFMPVYDEVMNVIKMYKNGCKPLRNIVKIVKSIEPGSAFYLERGVPFVRVSNLSKFEINNNNQQYVSETTYRYNHKYQPQKGEILLSKDASPGIAYFLDTDPGRMITSGGILRLIPKDNNFVPECLTLILNSILCKKQMERDVAGSIIMHWRSNQINDTLIPIIDFEKQLLIKNLISESFNNRRVSKQILEISKLGIEIAIEENETRALSWMENELAKLRIEEFHQE